MIVLFAVSTVPTMAHTAAHPQWNPLCAGSPHYYGEPGPKDESWYWNHRNVVGGVRVWNDVTHLFVEYDTTGYWDDDVWVPSDWVLTETHLAVATDPDDFPQTKSGNPKVGKFPYKDEGLYNTHKLYTIPLDSWGPGDILYIAAHAVVKNGCREETAWADCGGPDAYFPGNNWATYFTYTVQ